MSCRSWVSTVERSVRWLRHARQCRGLRGLVCLDHSRPFRRTSATKTYPARTVVHPRRSDAHNMDRLLYALYRVCRPPIGILERFAGTMWDAICHLGWQSFLSITVLTRVRHTLLLRHSTFSGKVRRGKQTRLRRTGVEEGQFTP